MQITREMNLTETAFISKIHPDDSFQESSVFGLRWFTPQVEVKLCGHATLASAKILFSCLGNKSEEITFKTLSGDLKARRQKEKIELNFPVGTTNKKNIQDYADLLKELNCPNDVIDLEFNSSLKYLLVRLSDGWKRETFEAWKPSISSYIDEDKKHDVFLVLVTVLGNVEGGFANSIGKPYDFATRVFDILAAVEEDPVTGSAHTVLAYYWSKQLVKNQFFARQCSKRGGDVDVLLKEDRVHLLGDATVVLEGMLRI